MSLYRITINEKVFDVTVEELDGEPEVTGISKVSAPVMMPSHLEQETPKKEAMKPTPAPAPQSTERKEKTGFSSTSSSTSGENVLSSPMPGKVLSITVTEGQPVKRGQTLLVFEAMKMENEVVAPKEATVSQIHVSVGSAIETGTPLITLS